ncbi:hypothetical protein ACIO6T_30875 [Streptomyces sp. NPDC087532]|uniref:hypothetical protein n=1 Tax=Streptomyces sp. NPDC087532 TaxID=3365795 RepID=UPI0038170DF3
MSDEVKAREEELVQLLDATRRALANGGAPDVVSTLRQRSENAFAQWRIATSLAVQEAALRAAAATVEAAPAPPQLKIREKAHAALLILKAPAPRVLVSQVYDTFHDDALPVERMSNLHLREAYSQPRTSREFFVCSVLTPDLQAARNLYASSTWPLEQRIATEASGKLWPLTGLAHLADAVRAEIDAGRDRPAALRLLRSLAGSTGMSGADGLSPERIAAQARQEMAPLLPLHEQQCANLVGKATQLAPAGQLFGHAVVRPTPEQKAALWAVAHESAERAAGMSGPRSARPVPLPSPRGARPPSPATGPATVQDPAARGRMGTARR